MDASQLFIYHITPIQNLELMLSRKALFCDKVMTATEEMTHTVNGMAHIKTRRLTQCRLNSYPDLFVGDCVPFYFCPRSVMLYMIARHNEQITYKEGEDKIIHLVANLKKAVEWAEVNNLRWAFTDSNAGSLIFNDFCNLNDLDKLNWDIIHSATWSGDQRRSFKQAEFLVEKYFLFDLFEYIGVKTEDVQNEVKDLLSKYGKSIAVNIRKDWYYND